MPQRAMQHDVDPRQVILDKIGDLSDIKVMYSQVLLGIYERPAKTKSGIIFTDQHRDEDLFQGKICMVLKMGPLAFQDTDDVQFHGQKVEVGDWVSIRTSDGWALNIRGQACRMVSDTGIRLVVEDPDSVY